MSLASTQPRPGSRFTLDLLPAVDLGFARGSMAGMLIQGGYSFTTGGTHLFVLGAGPAIRHFGPTLGMGSRGRMIAGLVANGVVGTVAGVGAAGVRTGVLLHMWVIGVELGHQYVVAGAQQGHELRLMIDLGELGSLGR